jgi:cell division protein FtsW (lipid II flippase)
LYAQKLFLMVASALLATITVAQDKKEIDVNVNSNKNNFWGQPWVWVIGAAIFILLLVAILRGGRRSDA